jgi:hypothetical protein
MQIPSILQGESLKRLVQGAIAGGAALMIVGSFWPGWVLESTAQKRTAAQEKSILVKALAPVCADKFRNQPDVTAQVAALKDVGIWIAIDIWSSATLWSSRENPRRTTPLERRVSTYSPISQGYENKALIEIASSLVARTFLTKEGVS